MILASRRRPFSAVGARFLLVLRRIVRRFSGGAGVVGLVRAEVVLHRNRLRVADPLACNRYPEFPFQFVLPAAPQIVKDLRPLFQTRPFDDPAELCPQVRHGVAVSDDDVFRAFRRGVVCFEQVRQQFREQRDRAPALPLDVLRLGAAHNDFLFLPFHVTPAQGEAFGWTPQAADSCQQDQQSPLIVRAGIEKLFEHFARHEVMARLVALNMRLEGAEGVSLDDLVVDCRSHELLGAPADASDGILAVTPPVMFRWPQQIPPETCCVAFDDLMQGFVCAEEIDQVSPRRLKVNERTRLHVRSIGNVGVDECGKCGPVNQFAWFYQPELRQFGVQFIRKLIQPTLGRPFDRLRVLLRPENVLQMPFESLRLLVAHALDADCTANPLPVDKENPRIIETVNN